MKDGLLFEKQAKFKESNNIINIELWFIRGKIVLFFSVNSLQKGIFACKNDFIKPPGFF